MISLGDTGLALCFWYETDHSEGRVTRDHAIQLLRRSQSDFWAQAALRVLVGDTPAGTALTRLSDHDILEAVADLIASGEIVLVRPDKHIVNRTGDTGAATAAKSPAPPPPPAPRPPARSTAPPPAQDPKIFPADVDPVLQAAVNRAAALEGAPFCEQ